MAMELMDGRGRAVEMRAVKGLVWLGCGHRWMGVAILTLSGFIYIGSELMDVVRMWQQWQWMGGRGQDVAILAMGWWAWSGCGHSSKGWMGVVRMWPHWQWMNMVGMLPLMDGRGRGMTVLTLSGCIYKGSLWMDVARLWPQWLWIDGRGPRGAICAMYGYGCWCGDTGNCWFRCGLSVDTWVIDGCGWWMWMGVWRHRRWVEGRGQTTLAMCRRGHVGSGFMNMVGVWGRWVGVEVGCGIMGGRRIDLIWVWPDYRGWVCSEQRENGFWSSVPTLAINGCGCVCPLWTDWYGQVLVMCTVGG